MLHTYTCNKTILRYIKSNKYMTTYIWVWNLLLRWYCYWDDPYYKNYSWNKIWYNLIHYMPRRCVRVMPYIMWWMLGVGTPILGHGREVPLWWISAMLDHSMSKTYVSINLTTNENFYQDRYWNQINIRPGITSCDNWFWDIFALRYDNDPSSYQLATFL